MPKRANDKDVILFNLEPVPYPPTMAARIDVSPFGDVRVRRKNRSLGPVLKRDYTKHGQARVKLLGPDGKYHNVLLHRLVYYACTRDDRMFRDVVVCVDGNRDNLHIYNLRLSGEETLDITPKLTYDVRMQLAYNPNVAFDLPDTLSYAEKLETLNQMLKELK